MDLRRMQRIEGGFACEIRYGTRQVSGTVTNLALDGLFVNSKVSIPPGSQVEIHIPEAKDAFELTLRAIVVRQRLLPNRVSRLKPQGIGLRILQAPEEYYQLIDGDTASSEHTGAPDDPPLNTFRVRVLKKGGSCFRILNVTSTSLDAARQEIEQDLGPEWAVTDVFSD